MSDMGGKGEDANDGDCVGPRDSALGTRRSGTRRWAPGTSDDEASDVLLVPNAECLAPGICSIFFPLSSLSPFTYISPNRTAPSSCTKQFQREHCTSIGAKWTPCRCASLTRVAG